MKPYGTAAAVALASVLLLFADPAGSVELGRLFFSPVERAALEAARNKVDVQPVVVVEPEAPPAPVPVVEQPEPEDRPLITVNGYVRRSRGPETVWINGVDNYQGDLSVLAVDRSSLRIDQGRVSFSRSHGQADLALKPGQTFMPKTRAVTDAYEPVVVEAAE